jgi:hypothetical protein
MRDHRHAADAIRAAGYFAKVIGNPCSGDNGIRIRGQNNPVGGEALGVVDSAAPRLAGGGILVMQVTFDDLDTGADTAGLVANGQAAIRAVVQEQDNAIRLAGLRGQRVKTGFEVRFLIADGDSDDDGLSDDHNTEFVKIPHCFNKQHDRFRNLTSLRGIGVRRKRAFNFLQSGKNCLIGLGQILNSETHNA